MTKNYRFKCPFCGGRIALIQKIDSIPYWLQINPGPSISLDFPDKYSPVVKDLSYKVFHLVCDDCGKKTDSYRDLAEDLSAQKLLDKGLLVEEV